MIFTWDLEEVEVVLESDEIDSFEEEEEENNFIRNPRHHVSNPKVCCVCEGPVADMSQDELTQAIRAWAISAAPRVPCRCQRWADADGVTHCA